MKSQATEPLVITQKLNPENNSVSVLTSTVSYEFLRAQRAFTNPQYAIGPHPYLIQRFLNTDSGQLQIEKKALLEVKSAPIPADTRYNANLQFQSIYEHEEMSKNYYVESSEPHVFNSTLAEFKMVVGTRNHSKFPAFDFIFIPGSPQSEAQFSPLKLKRNQGGSSKAQLTFQHILKSGNVEVMAHRSTFFLVARRREKYVPIEVDLSSLVSKISYSRKNALFRSVNEPLYYPAGSTIRNPTNILAFGVKGSGKTSFCSTIVNTVHAHGSGSKGINFSVITNAAPNPIIRYPSTLVNLDDTFGTDNLNPERLYRYFEFFNKKASPAEVCCFMLNVNDLEKQGVVRNTFLNYTTTIQANKKAILVLTHIDQCAADLAFKWSASEKLNNILFSLEQYGFSRIYPISNYRDGVHQEQNDFADHVSTQMLFSARFEKNISEDQA